MKFSDIIREVNLTLKANPCGKTYIRPPIAHFLSLEASHIVVGSQGAEESQLEIERLR